MRARAQKIFSIICVVGISVVAACDDTLELDEQLTFDPRLPATWVSVTGDDTLNTTPIVVHGLTIASDGRLTQSTVETSTGILADRDAGVSTQISRTANGEVFVDVSYDDDGSKVKDGYRFKYTVNDSLLRRF